MKKILTVVLCLISLSGFAQPYSFTIEGRIEGLEKGDTLHFIKVILPEWQMETAFEVAVSEPGRFRYDGTHDHTQLYLMTYTPADRERVIAADRRGRELLIRDGTTTITGDWEYICYSLPKGGTYTDPELQRLDSIENSIFRERGYCMKMIQQARKNGDEEERKKWSAKSNEIFSNPALKQNREEMKAYRERTFDSEYFAVQTVREAMSDPESSKAYYEKLTPEVKASHYGRMAGELLERMALLEPGRPAPPFTLTTTDGEQVTLETIKGNYLVIYHWGTCPGSMQMDGQMQELYARYRDKGVQVVGITEFREAVQSLFKSLPEDDTTEQYGIPLRKTLQGMLSHPFPDVELDKDPQSYAIIDQYAIDGLPFVVCISPEGTILSRGYWESFNEAKAILEREFPEGS